MKTWFYFDLYIRCSFLFIYFQRKYLLAAKLLDLSDNSISNLLGGSVTAQVTGKNTLLANILDTVDQLLGSFLLAEPFKHLCGSPEGGHGVGDTHAGDIESRAVNRLEHTGVLARRVEVGSGGNTDGASQRSSQVGENVSVLMIC